MTDKQMNANTIKYFKKAEKIQETLREFNFHHFEYMWYTDGRYSGCWKDLSVSMDEPEQDAYCHWQFCFRSKWSTNRRLHLEAVMPVFENYFVIDLRYMQDIELHNRKGYSGAVAVSSVEGILEEDLPNMQNFIDLLVK
jgi:hypothetical protein